MKYTSMIFQSTIKQLGVTQKVVLSEMYKLNNLLGNKRRTILAIFSPEKISIFWKKVVLINNKYGFITFVVITQDVVMV